VARLNRRPEANRVEDADNAYSAQADLVGTQRFAQANHSGKIDFNPRLRTPLR
jgi:hypothetical protein